VEGDVDTDWSLGLSGIMNLNEILMDHDGCPSELRNFGMDKRAMIVSSFRRCHSLTNRKTPKADDCEKKGHVVLTKLTQFAPTK
jgi:hypothetical protein